MADEAGSLEKKAPLQKPPGFGAPPTSIPRPPPRKGLPLPQKFRQAGKPVKSGHRKSICRGLCCCIVIFVFVLLFLLVLSGAIAYLYFQPRLPSFRLQAVQIPRFNATTRSDGSGTFLDAMTSIKIFASNQNQKITFYYEESSASVYVSDADGDVSVGSGSMAGFVQGRRNATVMRFTTSVRGVLVDDAVGTRLRSRFRSKEIKFRVEVKMRVGMGVSSRRVITWRTPMSVDCPPVSLKMVKGGRILPTCDVYFFSCGLLNSMKRKIPPLLSIFTIVNIIPSRAMARRLLGLLPWVHSRLL